MYYLLGFKLFGDQEGEIMKMITKQTAKNKESDFFGKSKIFMSMNEQVLRQVRLR